DSADGKALVLSLGIPELLIAPIFEFAFYSMDHHVREASVKPTVPVAFQISHAVRFLQLNFAGLILHHEASLLKLLLEVLCRCRFRRYSVSRLPLISLPA